MASCGKFTVINPRTVSHVLIPAPDSRRDIANFPSPTPNKGTTGWTGGQTGSHAGPSGNEGLQSPTPNSAHVSVSGQNLQGWSGGPPHNLQPNLVMNMAGLQQLAYNQWGGVPNMVQNTSNLVGNMQQPNMPQEQWGQFPFPVTQPNMQ
ncbi:hypothetical protein Tco_0312279 [Tanacetum coccineum]